MTTYRTGNAIGSADPRDLYDNAENLDELVNSQDKAEHPDRLGVPRKTWHGMEKEFVGAQADKQQRFNLLLANSGYEYLADYAAGIEITEYNQVLRDAAGELWRAAATTTLPYTTGGTGLPEGGAFVAVGDADIRNDLAAGVGAGKGALLVRGSVIYVDTIADLQALDASKLVDGQQVQVKEYHAGTGVGGGEFVWVNGDLSLYVLNDPQRGLYVAPDGESGENGAFKRAVSDNAFYSPYWFGARGNGVDDDTASLVALYEQTKNLESVFLDFEGGTFSLTIAASSLFDYSDKRMIHAIVSGSEFLDNTVYNASQVRALFKATNCSILFEGVLKVSGTNYPRVQGDGRGCEVISISSCSYTKASIQSMGNNTAFRCTSASASEPSQHVYVTIKSTDDHYGASMFNFTNFDISIDGLRNYRAVIFGGAQVGTLRVNSSGQIGASLLKHYENNQQTEDVDWSIRIRNPEPYVPTSRPVGIELQSESSASKMNNVHIKLDIINNPDNPCTSGMLRVVDINRELRLPHSASNVVVSGTLQTLGFSEDSISYLISGVFDPDSFSYVFRELIADAPFILSEQAGYSIDRCLIEGDLFTYTHNSSDNVVRSIVHGDQTAFSRIFKSLANVRRNFTLDYFVCRNRASSQNNWVSGRFVGSWASTPSLALTIKVDKAYELWDGSEASVEISSETDTSFGYLLAKTSSPYFDSEEAYGEYVLTFGAPTVPHVRNIIQPN